MKNLKFSFAFLIAILAVGITIATKANFSGKRVLTACYSTTITLQNASGTTLLNITPNATDCSVVKAAYTSTVIYLRTTPGTVVNPALCTDDVDFCCVQFGEIPDPANFPNVPSINIGGTVAKWVIETEEDIKCRD